MRDSPGKFLRTVADRRGRQGRSYPLEYLLPRLGAALGRIGQGIQPRQLREHYMTSENSNSH
jgi:hypothetical protein